ncbi:MAG: hypothetical protein V1663_02785 [archaeon]
MKKLLTIFLGLFLLASLFLVKEVNAQDFDITSAEINGIEFESLDPSIIPADIIQADRGESLTVKVNVHSITEGNNTGNDTVEGLKVKAWIGGYEYEDIEATSSMFDLSYGVTTQKTLTLDLPEDMDASQDYTLHVKAYTEDQDVEYEFTLQIEEARHSLEIIDVMFTPSLTLNMNQDQDSLFVTTRVKNWGDKKEEDVKVTVSVPELGISQSTYIDELVAHENSCDDNEENCDDNEEDSESSNALYLDLAGKEAGSYPLTVTVEYNNGYSEEEKEYTLTLTGSSGTSTGAQEAIIAAATSSKSIAQGEGVVYTIDLANLGDSSKVYTAEVTGLDTWATYRIDPSVVTVSAGDNGQLYIYVSAKDDAALGSHMFTVKVKENGESVKDINLSANVSGETEQAGQWDNIITGLEIGFIVLLIILVILGLIIAIGKMTKKEGTEEPTSGSGETYY